MSCNNCSTGGNGLPKGCRNNGSCTNDGCNKLTVFNWLANMSLPTGDRPFNIVEVRYKNGRKQYYKNPDNISLTIGDIVATQAQYGHDVGMVTLTGELVKIQLKRKSLNRNDKGKIRKIYRKASQKDIDNWKALREREEPMKVKARQFAIDLNLSMKISDIEFQGDGSKATFYYTAEDRVDFRELIKVLAKSFKTRIEMKQVGFRQEASRLGGIGSCGRELCCSTWMTDFRSISTSAARYQQLALNPHKLVGQCGKLKCCLHFELDAYLEALKTIPSANIKLYTEKGVGLCQKIDIFKGLMWYAYQDHWANWFKLTIAQVQEIIGLNKRKKKVSSLEEFVEDLAEPVNLEFENVVGQDSLTRFDSPKRRNRRRRNKRRKPIMRNRKQNAK